MKYEDDQCEGCGAPRVARSNLCGDCLVKEIERIRREYQEYKKESASLIIALKAANAERLEVIKTTVETITYQDGVIKKLQDRINLCEKMLEEAKKEGEG